MELEWIRAAILLSAAATTIACGASEDETKKMLPDGTMTKPSAEDTSIAELAKSVLAEELNIPISTITVDTVRPVEWRDSSIGCPQPGQAYMQVITPGHKITLRVDGRLHVVHEANGRAFICKIRKDKGRVTGRIDLVWGPQAVVARKDLADRLGVDEDLVMIAGARETTFTDSSLGCPEAGVEYDKRDKKGFVLRLRHGNRDYIYHTDLERTIPCPAISED